MPAHDGVDITLNTQELYLASIVGCRRRCASMRAGHQEMHGISRSTVAERWYANLVGAAGEMAFAKLAGLYWPASLNAPKSEPDVMPDWQVRCLACSHYDLIVRRDDPEHFRYALMTGEPPTFTFRGWIAGVDARRGEWFKDRGNRNAPAFWVPQSELTMKLPHEDR